METKKSRTGYIHEIRQAVWLITEADTQKDLPPTVSQGEGWWPDYSQRQPQPYSYWQLFLLPLQKEFFLTP